MRHVHTGAKKSINQASLLSGPALWDSKSLGPRASSLITEASRANAATSWAVTLPVTNGNNCYIAIKIFEEEIEFFWYQKVVSQKLNHCLTTVNWEMLGL